MLETRFPRVLGDVGNAGTWPFPVQFRIVRGASPHRVIRNRAAGLVEGFIEAGRDLVAHGVDALTTNCGFLSLVQEEIQDAVGVPVAASALMQIPAINALLPTGKKAGILTISQEHLSEDHLVAANVPLDTPIAGTDGGREFSRKILDDQPEIDFALCQDDLLDAAKGLVESHRDIGAVVLECTNMVPFAADIRKATGLPVFSIYTHICWLQSGLLPRQFTFHLHDPRRN